jgi:hypothetical protein
MSTLLQNTFDVHRIEDGWVRVDHFNVTLSPNNFHSHPYDRDSSASNIIVSLSCDYIHLKLPALIFMLLFLYIDNIKLPRLAPVRVGG